MKAIYLLICQLFILSSVLMAQPKRIEIKTLKDYQLKGAVKKVVTNAEQVLKFTPEGYLQFTGFLEKGKLTGATYTYDKAGHLLKEESWGGSIYVYTYNARGQMIREQLLSGTKCVSTTSYSYDANGHARQEILNGTVSSLKNTYDTQKRLIRIEHVLLPSNHLLRTTDIAYLPNGWTRYILKEKETQVIEEFDNKGRKRSNMMYDSFSNQKTKSVTNYDDNDNKIEYQSDTSPTILYTYNDQGDQITKEETYSWGTIKIQYTYTKYDIAGNWIERIVDKDGKQTTESRVIEYYE